jgi:hypothetical protein
MNFVIFRVRNDNHMNLRCIFSLLPDFQPCFFSHDSIAASL